MTHHLGFPHIVQKAFGYIPFSILIAINILWTCNLGPKFLSKMDEDGEEVLLDSDSALLKNVCMENMKIMGAMCIQVATFIAIKLVALVLLTLTGPFGIKLPRIHFRKFELSFLLLFKSSLVAALGLYLWRALSIPEESEFTFPHHSHFATLTLLILQFIYAILLSIRQFYFG